MRRHTFEIGCQIRVTDAESLPARLLAGAEAGFTACQLTFARNPTPELVVEAHNLARDHGLRVEAVGAPINLLRPDDAGFDGVSAQGVDAIIEALPDIKTRKVVIWSGTHGRKVADGHAENLSPQSWHAADRTARGLVERLRARKTRLLVRPCYRHLLQAPEDYLQFIEDIDRRWMGIVLDPSGFIRPEQVESAESRIENMVDILGHVTWLVHLRDVARTDEGGLQYLPPGRGRLNYKFLLASLTAVRRALVGIIDQTEGVSVEEMQRARRHVESCAGPGQLP